MTVCPAFFFFTAPKLPVFGLISGTDGRVSGSFSSVLGEFGGKLGLFGAGFERKRVANDGFFCGFGGETGETKPSEVVETDEKSTGSEVKRWQNGPELAENQAETVRNRAKKCAEYGTNRPDIVDADGFERSSIRLEMYPENEYEEPQCKYSSVFRRLLALVLNALIGVLMIAGDLGSPDRPLVAMFSCVRVYARKVLLGLPFLPFYFPKYFGKYFPSKVGRDNLISRYEARRDRPPCKESIPWVKPGWFRLPRRFLTRLVSQMSVASHRYVAFCRSKLDTCRFSVEGDRTIERSREKGEGRVGSCEAVANSRSLRGDLIGLVFGQLVVLGTSEQGLNGGGLCLS